MKKCISISIVAVMLLLLLAGCGTTIDNNDNSNSETENRENSLEVQKELFDVKITIPAGMVDEERSQADYDEMAKESGYKSITLNDDKSVTYVMTKSKHKSIMDDLAVKLDDGFKETIASEDNAIVNIEHNSNYSEFKVYLSTDTVGLVESINSLGLMLAGGIYNTFNGTSIDNVHIDYINQATGAVISSTDSSEMGK